VYQVKPILSEALRKRRFTFDGKLRLILSLAKGIPFPLSLIIRVPNLSY
jgi:hypothetical protein